jgi:hypothetical protein
MSSVRRCVVFALEGQSRPDLALSALSNRRTPTRRVGDIASLPIGPNRDGYSYKTGNQPYTVARVQAAMGWVADHCGSHPSASDLVRDGSRSEWAEHHDGPRTRPAPAVNDRPQHNPSAAYVPVGGSVIIQAVRHQHSRSTRQRPPASLRGQSVVTDLGQAAQVQLGSWSSHAVRLRVRRRDVWFGRPRG